MALNILIVDDSAVMRAMIVKTLQISGLPLGELFQAGNGQEGLEIISKDWIDLVLADINMPEMNGIQMIERIREDANTAHIPVLIISSSSGQALSDAVQRLGAGFIHKPFTPEQLRNQIIQITGVSDEQAFTNSPMSGGNFDF
jgi:two-component system, chemotaxis family, chemotaxis protein CheY